MKQFTSCLLLSSAVQPGTNFLENNKIIGVFTVLKLCVNKERLASNVTCNVEHDMMYQPKQSICHCFSTVMMSKLNLRQAMMLPRSKIHSI